MKYVLVAWVEIHASKSHVLSKHPYTMNVIPPAAKSTANLVAKQVSTRAQDDFLGNGGLLTPRMHSPAPIYCVREFRDIAALRPYRETWNALLAETADASYFLSYDWLENYWEHFRADQELRVLVIESPGVATNHAPHVVGILPLVVRREETRLGKVRVLTFPLHGWGTSYGPIGPDPQTTLDQAWRYLATLKRDFDLFDLRWLDDRRGLGDLASQAMQHVGFSNHRAVWFDAYHVNLQDQGAKSGWDAYWASRTSHWRTNVRSNLKKLAKLGAIEHVRYRPRGTAFGEADPRWDLYETCVELAARGWQGSRTDGTTLNHPQVRDYLRSAHEVAVRFGAADINLLYVAGQPVAFAYNYAYRGHVYGLRAGYDPAFKALGVGSVLTYHMLMDSCQRGDRVLDLGPGNMPSKINWLNEVVPAYHYTNYSAWSWRAWGLRLKRKLSSAAARKP
jgi:CelD/BcsL family acetyltransferase involved in cellulose biosynthesis